MNKPRGNILTMKLDDEIRTSAVGTEAVQDYFVEEGTEPVERKLPTGLRYFMLGLLITGVISVVGIGYLRQSSIKAPPAPADSSENCKDPVVENRLRETLKQSPNDFATLMDWGGYNLNCEENYPVAVAAYQQALLLSKQTNSAVKPDERVEAQFRLGLSHLNNKNLHDAQTQFEGILAEQPQNTSAMLALGAAFSRQNKTEQASLVLKRVIDLEPNSEKATIAQTLLTGLNTRPAGGAVTLPPPPSPRS